MQKLSVVKAGRVADGSPVKRTRKSRTWFNVIVKLDKGGVVLQSQNSDYTVIVKKSAEVYI